MQILDRATGDEVVREGILENRNRLGMEYDFSRGSAKHRYQRLMNYIEEARRFGQVPEDQRREGQSMEEIPIADASLTERNHNSANNPIC